MVEKAAALSKKAATSFGDVLAAFRGAKIRVRYGYRKGASDVGVFHLFHL